MPALPVTEQAIRKKGLHGLGECLPIVAVPRPLVAGGGNHIQLRGADADVKNAHRAAFPGPVPLAFLPLLAP